MTALRYLPAGLLGITILACSSAQEPERPSAEEDLAAISEARAGLLAALSTDDIPGILAVVAEDHLTMPPDGPVPADNRALAEYHQARVDSYSFESVFTTDDIRLFGDVAVERFSTDKRFIPREGGEDLVDSTKGVWVWERQEDGSWKILWSIWNSNLPVEPDPGVGEGA